MDGMQTKKRSVWLWILSSVLILVLILGGVAWYLSRQWKPILESQLKQLVLNSSDSLYTLEYDNINLNLVTGNASLKNFKLIPNLKVYEKLVIAKKAPDNIYDLSVERVAIKNFHPKQLYQDKKLMINSILIDNPTLVITNKRLPFNDTIPTQKKPKTLYQLISSVFKAVQVNDIQLKDIDFTFLNKSNAPEKKTAIKNLTVNVNDLLIDSLSENDKSRFYNTRNIDVLMQDYKIAMPDSLYFLVIKNFAFSSQQRKLQLDEIQLQPRYTRTQFHQKVKYAKDRFDLSFKGISINNIDIPRFIREQKLYASSLDLNRAVVDVYNNNAYKKVLSNKKGKDPHQQLQKLALDLKIDTVNLKRADISYTEHDRTTKKNGIITFDRTAGKIFNVTNDSASLIKNHFMKANLTSRVMNTGKLTIRFTFDLTSKLGDFTYAGSLGAMNGVALNKITQPLGMLYVQHANIRKLDFDISANQNLARGKVAFYYNDLNVQILKRDETGTLKRQGFISSIANMFVVRPDNPGSNGKFIPGTVYNKRESTKSFFSFLWQSLFVGIKESIGVNEKKESTIKNTVKKVGGFIENLKEKRAEGKQKRQERREQRQLKKEAEKKQEEKK